MYQNLQLLRNIHETNIFRVPKSERDEVSFNMILCNTRLFDTVKHDYS